MVAEMLVEGGGDRGTHYTVCAMYWDEAELTDHENMGSHEGWSKASDPLEALAMTL